MDAPEKTLSELVGTLKSWLRWRSEPAHLSRDFWMPDQSCRVCYECDSQFTLFNRRHHCRLCGRIFCGQCTANSVPAPSVESDSPWKEWENIRVCNYCFKQWQQQSVDTVHNGTQAPIINLSTSPSAASLVSTKSSGTAKSSSCTPGLLSYSTASYQQAQHNSGVSPHPLPIMEKNSERPVMVASRTNNDHVADIGDPSPNQFSFSMNSDDEDDEYGVYRSDSETRHFRQVNDFYSPLQFNDMSNDDGSHRMQLDQDYTATKSLSSSPLLSFGSQGLEEIQQLGKKDGHDIGDECEAPSSLYASENANLGPVDFENDGVLWLPPDPEDEEDDREADLFDDDDDDGAGDPTGEWGYFRTSSSFSSGEFRNRDKSFEEHKNAMKNVVDGHFRALVAQLLQVENLPVSDEDVEESWLEIITALSWEAATLLKPDMSKNGGMDPGGYVKVKCIASGRRLESMVVKGVVCKKNVAHRRMTSKVEKPRLLILGGALEYQRVSNHLSSFDTLLQQEMDHLKMAVAKIDAHRPDVLLVEKSVSRFAQDYLLAKNISLVLNIKRPLLERIARCTGSQIVPSIDHLSSPKLGYCDTFHAERFLEDLGSAGQGGKKLVKTLMYFEGCPKPLGCTILLRGANGDELKKVKHVLQYGIFAAYHLALETSFLADEGASLPELPMNSPISVALPDKPSSIERSISTVPGFTVPANEESEGPPHVTGPQRSKSVPISGMGSLIESASIVKMQMTILPSLSNTHRLNSTEHTSSLMNSTTVLSSAPSTGKLISDSFHGGLLPHHAIKEKNKMGSKETLAAETSAANNEHAVMNDHVAVNGFEPLKALGPGILANGSQNDTVATVENELGGSDVSSMQQDSNHPVDQVPLKEEFPPSPSDHQSILVSLSSRCVWKGTVCERSHLFRIKYYGSFDKPLGRFLRDHLFDQSYRCRSCDMPSEAHVHCYTHRQGTLTISVKKLPEILLLGEKEGKIWMWHRCLQCPRINGFPPATRRVVMSDAAWGLSFGKFLELSFSNHAAASRVASCGHSLHRDCLRFYGFGKMVACFRYASIDVHSVYLPPHKLDFSYDHQEWIQKEANEVANQAKLLFSEVLNALSQIVGALNNGIKTLESRHQTDELEVLLQKEKSEFEELLQKALNREIKRGQPPVDILEINRLRRQLLFQSYMWDHRLVYAANLVKNSLQNGLSSAVSEEDEKVLTSSQKPAQMNVTTKSETDSCFHDSLLIDTKLEKRSDNGEACDNGTGVSNGLHQETNKDRDSDHKKEDQTIYASVNASEPTDSREAELNVHRVVAEGQFAIIANLSGTLEAKWTGENSPTIGIPKDNACVLPDSALVDSSTVPVASKVLDSEDQKEPKGIYSSALSNKVTDNIDDSVHWLRMPFLNIYRSVNKNFLASAQKLDTLGEYNPLYVKLQGGAGLLLPVGVNDTVVPVYDDEPTSIISYALLSAEYHVTLQVDDGERPKDGGDLMSSISLSDSAYHQLSQSFDGSIGSTDDGILAMSGSHSSLILDPLSDTKAFHPRIFFKDDGPLGMVRYSVTCYYAKRFEALRRICCPSELDFIRSLSRCKKWGAQGGKSNVFFAKTLDDRFIIKQVTKTELESFIKFAPEYFKYLSESINTGSPTCLAKILGIYQVTSKHLRGGKELKMDVLVMENLLFARSVTRLYDLKGSTRSRYNPDSSGSNKVLLDQNLIEAMPTSPIFVGNKAKRLLERAVWNDTAFLASVDVMDYSLLVGVDEEKHELVLGIIDFMRQYTWDKHLETWVKASGILGGPKNTPPTVISPKQYKKRFRKAMTTYFLMVPDQWFPPIIPSKSQDDLCEENT
ncbi:1-phosphatidylinositol-3-phosphate 5-kinase FAB1B-like isoform X2 [Mangifera indica]|uniref:1-phosphatidylinositol-3-phosphate 5-kinase FAB1B-like isoform X2 n=1 Tax=Mangifera indica TaxID=29780 RepID=UPI001CFBF13A|nr:1-phosphatidylinositol-3-phosphate 5-kinase FAB1B-like isoform X2 [Mangifera indica]